MTREDFLSNVRDCIEFQSGAGISALEWVIRYVFDLDSRPDIIFACNQMLIGDSEPLKLKVHYQRRKSLWATKY
jgi:hypothetical protein